MARTRGFGIAACAGIALLAVTSICTTGSTRGEEDRAADDAVSLHHGDSSGQSSSDAIGNEGSAGATSEVTLHEAAAANTKLPTATSSRTRGLRQRSSRESAGSMGDRATPWYRSGIGALAIVLALVGAASWGIRRWIPTARAADGRLLQVVARANISPKHSVVLVGVGRRFLLLGVSGDRVTPLGEVSDPEEVAELSVRAGAGTKRTGGVFDDLLSRESGDYTSSITTEMLEDNESDSIGRVGHGQSRVREAVGSASFLDVDVGDARLSEQAESPVREPLGDLLLRLRSLQSS